MDALMSALSLLATVTMAGFLGATGWARFTSGRATGFTRMGAPHVSFPRSAVLGAVEVTLGVGLLLLPAPGSMVAAYVAMAVALIYAVLAWRSWRRAREQDSPSPGDVTARTVGIGIALCGVAVIAFVDAITLQPAVLRLLDPATLAWLGGLVALGTVIATTVRFTQARSH